MNLSLSESLALGAFLAKHIETFRKEDLGARAAQEMTPGERLAVKFGGRLAAWVSMPQPAVRATVKNEAALIAWVRKHLPDEIETVERVRPSSARLLGEQMKAQGGWIDPDGVLVPVDGIEVSAGDPSPRVELGDDAEDAIRAAWVAGEIDLGALLALPAAEPGPEPWPLMTEETPFGAPFCDEYGFVSPEMAAAHAVAVQGGFSTPPIEAYRMLRSVDDVEHKRALAWLEKHGLDPADPREGQDTPWPLPEAAA